MSKIILPLAFKVNALGSSDKNNFRKMSAMLNKTKTPKSYQVSFRLPLLQHYNTKFMLTNVCHI